MCAVSDYLLRSITVGRAYSRPNLFEGVKGVAAGGPWETIVNLPVLVSSTAVVTPVRVSGAPLRSSRYKTWLISDDPRWSPSIDRLSESSSARSKYEVNDSMGSVLS